ncbi:MAG: hypothetical protein ABIK28_07215 [Planctomycetota bacterium]
MIVEKESLYHAIDSSVDQAMENLVFMEVEHCRSEKSHHSQSPGIWSIIEMQEPIRGQVLVWMPIPLIAEIMNTVFDIPDEISYEPELMGMHEIDSQSNPALQDAINEVANTLAGLFMNKWVASNQQFLIGLPEAHFGNPHVNDAYVCSYKMNNHRFWVAVQSTEIKELTPQKQH